MRKGGLENLSHTGHTETEGNIEKLKITDLTSLCKWMTEQGEGKIAKTKQN